MKKRGRFRKVGEDAFEIEHKGWFGFAGLVWTLLTLNHQLKKHGGKVEMKTAFPMPWW